MYQTKWKVTQRSNNVLVQEKQKSPTEKSESNNVFHSGQNVWLERVSPFKNREKDIVCPVEPINGFPLLLVKKQELDGTHIGTTSMQLYLPVCRKPPPFTDWKIVSSVPLVFKPSGCKGLIFSFSVDVVFILAATMRVKYVTARRGVVVVST